MKNFRNIKTYQLLEQDKINDFSIEYETVE
jgi:hypothetical protein